MSLKRYVKKPVVVRAFQWDGETIPDEALDGYNVIGRLQVSDDGILMVKTLEGTVVARPGDYVCFGDHGDVWPVRKDIFEDTYEPAP